MDAKVEQIIDRRVWARLATDKAYKNAENAEEQAIREDEITEQVEREVYAEITEKMIGE